uniref:DNA-binding protein RFX2 n=2 Tax=Cacopsylla melanoneura TaxID=428564 RepID=A0A8D8X1B8_9HEMI
MATTGIPSNIVRCDSPQQLTPATITVVTSNPQTLIVQPLTTNSKQITAVLQRVGNNQGAEILPLTPKSDGEDDQQGHQSPNSSPTGQIVDATHFIVTEGTGSRSYTSLTPVNPTVDPENVGSDQVTHSTFVQYVENGTEQAIYTNGQMAYPVYTVGDSGTMYTAASSDNQFFAPGTTPVTYTQEVAYIVEDQDQAATATSNTGDPLSPDNPASLSHVTKISPATVQWLIDNYETAEGVSLPRSSLFNHYIRHCADNKLDAVNAASFGKLIRSVFIGLRTRRLGTRGNSKYHYYGIRVKPDSPLNNIQVSDENGSPRSGKKYKLVKTDSNSNQYSETGGNTGGSGQTNSNPSHAHSTGNHNFLGDGSNAIPDFPEIDFSEDDLPEDCTIEDVDTFRSIYREHCEAFLDAIVTLDFSTIESLWREFWRSQDNNNGDECEEEKYLSKNKLFCLSKCLPVQAFVRRVDFLFYQSLVEVLIPDVLRPIPGSLTSSIRNFAKAIESWLTSAMQGCPQEMLHIKVTAVGAFAQMLRRYTSLNHLAQAARAVLQNSTQINQMLTDLNRVDFHNVQEQASWVCQCDASLVQQLESDFKLTLQQQNSLEEWASWLKNVVNAVLKPFEGKPNFTKAARQFLLKWSFYSSMVIRDLTLRSAASFGSFHLIRLLYDEYMFYLIEHQVALATGETPIAVIGSKDSVLAQEHASHNMNMDNGMYHHETNTILVHESDMHITPKRIKLN